MSDSAPARRSAVRWVVVLVAALAAFSAIRATSAHHVPGDFLRYHRAGRMVVRGESEHLYDRAWLRGRLVYAEERAEEAASGEEHPDTFPEEEFKYAPAVAVLMAPLGALHPRTAWLIWAAWNGALLGVTFAAAWAFAARGASWRWILVPALVLVRPAQDNVQLGQINLSAIAPATVALWALDRRRDVGAGLAAAFGFVVKFYPGALALFFAWKRRWLAAAACVGAAVAMFALLPLAAFGSTRTVALHEAWWTERGHVYIDAHSDDLPGHSIKSFVYRVFGGTHYKTGSARTRVDWDVSVAHANPATLQWTVATVVVALLGVVLAATWGPLRGGDDPRGPPEAGIFLCWMLLASPEARSPHFLYLALPLAALTYALVRARSEAWPRRGAAIALAVLGAIFVNCECSNVLGRTLAARGEAFCVQGWATLAFLAALLLVRRGAEPAAAVSPPVA